MPVTKRTRFEVLRRDENTCQYCGQKAPDVPLQIDHVIPVALGGSDSPSNLVTACRDCNSGKSSVPADAPLVETVSVRSAEWALASKNRMTHIESDIRAMETFEDEFLEKWEGFTYRQGVKDVHVPMPTDWRATLKGWWRIGVPKALIESAVDTVMSKSLEHHERFRYFCGVIWRTLDDYDQRYPEQTAEGRVYGPDEYEENAEISFRVGYDSGYLHGTRDARAASDERDILRRLIDGELAAVA
jgi:hypothetical protein